MRPKTQPTVSESDPRWQALLARDPAADPSFVYGVRTTGVYCRASSPARRPRIENVEFFATAAEAEAAGYRPSRRRGTDQNDLARQHAVQVARACKLIEEAETEPSLEQLAEQVNMSPYHFHRVFKRATGLTPKAYATAHRAQKLRQHLQRADSITEAVYEAGFNSNSRFYESSNARLGMTPATYRDGGAKTDIHFAIAQCSLGAILVAQSTKGICAILLGDDPQALLQDLQDKFPKAHFIGADAAFERLVARVVGFVEAPAIGLDLPLDLRGTAFQERVWQALRDIPVGSTASYAEIAERIGSPKAVRAVAKACAANSIAVAVPCHRVVRSDGNLSGYRWGVARKQQLLERERT
ncbi:bifunctional DNA-binding transcriptional regulator/O6-methylguanine-DNA methyltransferase Ada [Pseudomonas sp. Irchel 3E13]|uniref:bifunctional DNA-binding transcriptional regulator/O6-methylguanine-DNA methyltransferase Ada n=1 Tax=Pseudomonas sp. Irchel 3E13 TaxID=2008975 RepID=UPI000BA30F9B|nr:bifunctional DNA-binding transcriptional regulator/O6-methylguanine-DNA methyltransferase Ada [Pseudomonas sp. Irchel 3E13]